MSDPGGNRPIASGSHRVGHSKIQLLLFAFLLLPYAYFNQSEGWNQGSRLALLHSVVIRGSVNIDAYHRYTGDKALIDGHYYSEKAPAVALMALPAFTATVVVQRLLGIDPDSQSAFAISRWTATAASVGVVAALGGLAFLSLLRRTMSDSLAVLATIALFLGTLEFPYATSLFSHAATAGLLAIALWGALETDPRSSWRTVVAGLCAGLAVASEYPAILGVTCLGAYVWYRDRIRALQFALGMLPALTLILINNYVISGSPLPLYGSNPEFPMESAANEFGHGLPNLHAAVALLFSEYRGLFFWSPVLLLAIPGLVRLAHTDRALAIMVLAASTLSFLQVASFYNWFGGHAVGPRYLAPSFAFVGLAAAHGIAHMPRIGMLLTLISVALMTMVTGVGISPPQAYLRPLREYYFRRIEEGRFTTNLGTLAGLSPISSLALLVLLMGMTGWFLLQATRRK